MEYPVEKIRKMIYGIETKVELDDKRKVFPINLDNGATTPPFKRVCAKIQEELLMYGSIGRGTGQKSRHSSEFYTNARKTVLNFVGANHEKYGVFYVNCTTDGMNKLASALVESPRDIILSTRMEHHANDLPWRERAHTIYVEVDAMGRLNLDEITEIFDRYRDSVTGENKIKYVTVTAASNVTGYVNKIHDIAAIAHDRGAKIIVDGAQIVAHQPFHMLGDAEDGSEDIDFLVFSAHKLYSPFGGGAVVGLRSVLDAHLPAFYGGGMVNRVADDDVDYAEMPDRYEGGSPNYPGVVGMVEAMNVLSEIGLSDIEKHEQTLLSTALKGLAEIDDVILYGDSTDLSNRVGTVVFNIATMESEEVANQLAGKYGIAVRHAKFCAHPYVDRLIANATSKVNCTVVHWGMVRASFGVYTSEDEVKELIRAVRELPRTNANATFAADRSAPSLALPNDRG